MNLAGMAQAIATEANADLAVVILVDRGEPCGGEANRNVAEGRQEVRRGVPRAEGQPAAGAERQTMNLAYVAGIFDGEGSVRFAQARGTVFPVVYVTNTSRDLLLALQEKFGGDIQPLSARKHNWKQGFSWRISWSRAVRFLEQISKYLIIKQRHAHTIFAWDAIRPGSGAGHIDVDALDLLVARMKWLNKKGPINGVDPIDQCLSDQTEGKH